MSCSPQDLPCIVSVMCIVNLAHGNFYMAGAYAFLVFSEGRGSLMESRSCSNRFLLVGGMGMVVEAKLYRRLGRTH